MPAITIRSGHTGHWIKMRRSPVRSSRLEASSRIRSLVDSITITSGSRFSAGTWSTFRTQYCCFSSKWCCRLNSRLLFSTRLLSCRPHRRCFNALVARYTARRKQFAKRGVSLCATCARGDVYVIEKGRAYSWACYRYCPPSGDDRTAGNNKCGRRILWLTASITYKP